jgi:hypothetical protein
MSSHTVNVVSPILRTNPETDWLNTGVDSEPKRPGSYFEQCVIEGDVPRFPEEGRARLLECERDADTNQ